MRGKSLLSLSPHEKNEFAPLFSHTLRAINLFYWTFFYALISNPLYKQPMRYVTIGNVYLTVTSHWGLGGSILFFNQDLPYLQNITDPGPTEVDGGFDWCGTHLYKYKSNSMRQTWWSFMFSIWYPIAIFSSVSLLFLVEASQA